MNPFEAFGYGMMRAALEAEAAAKAVPVAAVKKKKRPLPRQQRLPIDPVDEDDDELPPESEADRIKRDTAARIESELERRRRFKERRKPTEEEEQIVRASQVEPAAQDLADRDAAELIDSTFLGTR